MLDFPPVRGVVQIDEVCMRTTTKPETCSLCNKVIGPNRRALIGRNERGLIDSKTWTHFACYLEEIDRA